MTLAKARDVDMVLLAGDLFHENKPSRNSMYQVLRSLRKNCLGEKPCELEFLGDGSEVFGGYVLPVPSISIYGANRGEVHSIMSITRTPISMLRFQSFQSMGIMMILLERVISQHWICFRFPGWSIITVELQSPIKLRSNRYFSRKGVPNSRCMA